MRARASLRVLARREWLVIALGLACAVTTIAAHASDRFVPNDSGYVIATGLERRVLSEPRGLESTAAGRTDDARTAAALARRYIELARSRREPRYFGRAAAVLQPWLARERATSELRVLEADLRQQAHDFDGARALLDSVLAADARNEPARALRGSIRLVTGDFSSAQRDCAWLVGGARSADHRVIGAACLAGALAGHGDARRALALLAPFAAGSDEVAPAAGAYAAAVRGELHERLGDRRSAETQYRYALSLDPNDDATRAALADLLLAAGHAAEARAVLMIERPSLALLVRQVRTTDAGELARATRLAREVLDVAANRGDPGHDREAALLARDGDRDLPRALELARQNFSLQKQLIDVRLYAELARAVGSRSDLEALRQWRAATKFDDATLARLLGDRASGAMR